MSLLLFSAEEFTVNPEVRVVMSLFLLKFIYLLFSVSSGYNKDIFIDLVHILLYPLFTVMIFFVC